MVPPSAYSATWVRPVIPWPMLRRSYNKTSAGRSGRRTSSLGTWPAGHRPLPGADALAPIAAALAASINAIGPAGITVAVEGNSLLITERNGAEFETAALIALDTDTNGTISAPVSSVATVLTLRGTPVTDDTWHLTVNGFIYNVSVDATTDTLAEIAVKLATLINADDINAPNLIATAVGDSLVIVDTSGAALTTSFTLLLAGSVATVTVDTATETTGTLAHPAIAGDVWDVALTGGNV